MVSRGAARPDVLSVIEAVYAAHRSPQSWLQAIVDASAECLSHGAGVGALAFSTHARRRFRPEAVASAGAIGDLDDWARAGVPGVRSRAVPAFFSSDPPVILLSDVFRRVGQADPSVAAIRERLLPLGFRDMVAVRSHDSAGHVCAICIPLADRTTLAPRRRWTLTCVATHMTAALRLRKRLADLQEEPDAVFDAKGRLQHRAAHLSDAEGSAIGRRVDAIEYARRHLRGADGARALEIWRGLVRGEWSIVQRVERDGKRYILARRNDPSVWGPSNLSRRESMIAAHAALGHSNKLIAYEIGLSRAAVSQLLKSGLRKLGLSRSEELALVFGPARRSGDE